MFTEKVKRETGQTIRCKSKGTCTRELPYNFTCNFKIILQTHNHRSSMSAVWMAAHKHSVEQLSPVILKFLKPISITTAAHELSLKWPALNEIIVEKSHSPEHKAIPQWFIESKSQAFQADYNSTESFSGLLKSTIEYHQRHVYSFPIVRPFSRSATLPGKDLHNVFCGLLSFRKWLHQVYWISLWAPCSVPTATLSSNLSNVIYIICM